MKTLGRIVLGLALLLVVAVAIVYADGAAQPVDHTTTVVGIVPAPPAKVFSIITNVAAGASWRSEVKAVQVLPPDNGRDHWVEDLGHGQKMDFVAIKTLGPLPNGNAVREVLLNDPGASYGGTWVYDVSQGSTPNETRLKITETGFIKPPIYRFIMAHVFGMTRNLDLYMNDIQAAAAKA